VLEGGTVKAKTEYQNFLTLWKDADPRHSHPETSQGGVCEAEMSELLRRIERMAKQRYPELWTFLRFRGNV